MKYGDAQLALINRERRAARSQVTSTLKRTARNAVERARQRPLLTAAAVGGGAVLVTSAIAPARRLRAAIGGLLRAGFGLMKLQGTFTMLNALPKDLSRHVARLVPPPADNHGSVEGAKRALRRAAERATE